MNKAMNKLLLEQVQYDLGSGLFISLVIGMISTFINAGGYFLGISVAAINYFVSGYVIAICLGQNKKPLLVIVSYFLRLVFIVMTIMPFTKNINFMVFYTIGFVAHYIILIALSIKNRKGSV